MNPLISIGGLNLLARSMAKHSPALPDVPTFQEAGLKNLVLDQRTGVFVPVGTPVEITTRLNAEVNAALSDGTVRKVFSDQTQDPAGGMLTSTNLFPQRKIFEAAWSLFFIAAAVLNTFIKARSGEINGNCPGRALFRADLEAGWIFLDGGIGF